MMEVGIFFQPLDPPGNNIAYTYQRNLDTIEWVEKLGFAEAWIGEHHSGGWENIPAPELLIAAAAERTKRIMLGPAVIPLPYHNPVLVATRMAMLDQLTRGRAMLAVGPSVIPTDRIMFGVDADEAYERTNEGIELILQLYRNDDPVTFHGRFYRVDDMELQIKPYQRPHMPIAMPGSASGNAFRQCGRLGLSPFSPFIFSGKDLASHWDIVEEHAEKAGRPRPDRKDWRINRCIYVAETDEQAFDDIRRGAMRVYRDYYFPLIGAGALWREAGESDDSAITLERMAEKSDWIIGSPETCRDKLRRFHDDVGGFGTVVASAEYFAPRDKVHRSLELFASEVLPHFQEQGDWTKRSEQRWYQVRASEETVDFTQATTQRQAMTHPPVYVP